MSTAGEAGGSAVTRALSRRTSPADRFFRLRDRLLSNPSFFRLSGATLFGRMIARREARAMFDVAAGFVYAQVLSAVVRLELLELLLAEGPLETDELARRLELPDRSLDRLLMAAEPLRLVARRDGGRWGLGYRGASLLGNPGVIAMVRHHDMLYRDLADPLALLRRGIGADMSAFWPYARAVEPGGIEAGAVDGYSRLMADSQQFIADEVLATYPFGRHRHVLEVGGGEGVFALALARRHPHLAVTVFDLPPVAARAATRFAEAGHADRLSAVGGDFVRDALPQGADAATLVRIVHDHDDDTALALLRNVAEALPPGGTLILAEPMAGSAGAPGLATYFAIYLLAMGSGRLRTPQELCRLLSKAGFASARPLSARNPTTIRLISAKRRAKA